VNRRLVIVGAGDFARELLCYCSDIPQGSRDWTEVAGFVDDRIDEASSRMKSYGIALPVLSTIANYSPDPRDLLICSIGDPKAKLQVCETLYSRKAHFTNLIHPSVKIMPGSSLGVGVVMSYMSWLGPNVRLGNFVTINSASSCGHDVVVEDGSTINAHCDITGHAYLERGAFLGSHASVIPGVRIGAFAKVGAGSVAYRNVKPGDTVVGVPAKVIVSRA
jgi:sugar O-acyltransferase (sialic acid O-acetyltransferase NeuD family)